MACQPEHGKPGPPKGCRGCPGSSPVKQLRIRGDAASLHQCTSYSSCAAQVYPSVAAVARICRLLVCDEAWHRKRCWTTSVSRMAWHSEDSRPRSPPTCPTSTMLSPCAFRALPLVNTGFVTLDFTLKPRPWLTVEALSRTPSGPGAPVPGPGSRSGCRHPRTAACAAGIRSCKPPPEAFGVTALHSIAHIPFALA